MCQRVPAATCSTLHVFSQFPVVFVSLFFPPAASFTLLFYVPLIFLSDFVSLPASLFIFCSISVSLFPLLIPVPLSSRQMAGLGVMVRCLGGVMAYRVEGYTAKDTQPERIPVSLLSATFLCSPSLSLHFPKHVLSLPDVDTQSWVLGLPAVPQRCIHMCVCLLTEWGFVERDSPQSGAGNRLESEPPCPDSLISSLIHGRSAGSTRAQRHTEPAPRSKRRRKSTHRHPDAGTNTRKCHHQGEFLMKHFLIYLASCILLGSDPSYFRTSPPISSTDLFLKVAVNKNINSTGVWRSPMTEGG